MITTAQDVATAPLDELWEYVDHSHEAESEQRAEFGMGAVSMGWDPYDMMGAYDGYCAARDEIYAAAKARLAAECPPVAVAVPAYDDTDDIPF